MKKFASILFFMAVMSSSMNLTATESVVVNDNNTNNQELVDVCLTRFDQNGEPRRQRTIQLRERRAERLVAFFNQNPDPSFTLQLGACE